MAKYAKPNLTKRELQTILRWAFICDMDEGCSYSTIDEQTEQKLQEALKRMCKREAIKV